MKYLAKIGLLTTGVLMLLFSVMPHHHHGTLIHFSLSAARELCSACTAEEAGCCHSACDHAAEGENSHNEDMDCDLRQLFLFSARQEQILPSASLFDADDHPASAYLTAILLHGDLPALDAGSSALPDRRPHLSEPLRSLCGGPIRARRGPPVS